MDSIGGVASKVHRPHMKVFATAALCLAAELRPLARTPCGFPLVVLDVSEARVEHQVCQSILCSELRTLRPNAVLRLSHQDTSPRLRLVHTRSTSMLAFLARFGFVELDKGDRFFAMLALCSAQTKMCWPPR
jgi:hypothetical protein